jgi:predicted helicase
MAQALGGSGDGGVDGVVNQDPLGLDRVYVQAKRYAGTPVGPAAINSFIGALNIKRANKGLFVTASTFTRQALARISHPTPALADLGTCAKRSGDHDAALRRGRRLGFSAAIGAVVGKAERARQAALESFA